MEAYFRVTQKQSGGGSGATITVTYASSFYGKTITCSDGVTTYTATTTSSGSTTFNVNAEGTWTITCNGTSKTVNVVLSYTTEMSITKTITVYSAANDTVSFTDLAGSKTVTTDSTGAGSVSITYSDGANITFTSSVAKDPYDLTSYYSKQITLMAATTEIYVMPDNCYYWYGYINNMEDVTAANGYSVASGCSMLAPTKNTNNMYMSSGVSQFVLESTANAISSGKTVKALMDCTTVFASVGSTLEAYATKYLGDGSSAIAADQFSAVSDIALKGFTLPSDGYIVAGSINRRAGHVYALWVEN